MEQTFPDVTSFVTNATSVKPPGAGPISHTDVSSASPGRTGLVNRKPKYRRPLGSPPPTSVRIPRATNPNVESP